jgi:hypothetical protein
LRSAPYEGGQPFRLPPLPRIAKIPRPELKGCPPRGTNGFRALNPTGGRRGTMTRELHVYDHASGMIALLFVSPNGTVEAFDVEGFNRIGEFASVAEAAVFACADVEMPRLNS